MALKGLNKKQIQRVLFSFSGPYPPTNLTTVLTSGRVITVMWFQPTEGVVDHYLVELESTSPNVSDHTHEHNHINSSVTGTSYSFTRLHPGETYTISVSSVSGNMTSDAEVVTETTSKFLFMSVFSLENI